MTDWQHLRAAAVAAAQNAYAPYSNYQVGAAALSTAGTLVTGCNVENASYGLTLCAECGLVSALVAADAGAIAAVVCVTNKGEIIMPCGRCRQLLQEHSTQAAVIMSPVGEMKISELLPQAFSPENLSE